MQVREAGMLLDVLYILYKDSSKKKVKGYLKSGCVYVDGMQVTKYDFWVKKGSTIEIRKENKTHKRSPLPILFEDEVFLVVDKPSGLLSIGTEKEKERTAYHKMRNFVKERGRCEKIFILHRLDRDTSGVLVFVKEEKIKHLLQENWNHFIKERSYVAVVKGLAKERDTLRLSLEEGKDLKMHVVHQGSGKLCITKYKCIRQGKSRSLLDISLETGRKNQIRASLAHVGLPVLGDTKYSSCQKEARLYLHASRVVLEHPITHKQYVFSSEMPSIFQMAVKE